MEKIRGVLFDLEGALLLSEQPRRAAPGAWRAVRQLYDRGYRLGILTGRSVEEVLEWLRREGLIQYFEAVCPRGPEGRSAACEQLGLEPAVCAWVTGEAEREMGIRVLAADREDGADPAVRRLADLPSILR